MLKSDFMLEELIKDYFTQYPFNNQKFPIFETDCNDENCKLNGNFNKYIILNGDNIKKLLNKHEKSVDRIILKEVSTKEVDVILCELTSGKKRYTSIVEKIKKSGEYILTVLKKLNFKVRDFKCIFVGKYKNPKRIKPKPFSIPSFHKNNINIKKLDCGSDFPQSII